MNLLAEQGAAAQHYSQLAAEHSATNTLKQQTVQQPCGPAGSEIVEFLLISNLEKELLEPT